jgi:spore coat protein CotH
MKIKFEKGKKIYISNDGRSFTSAEDCVEHDLEILHGTGRNKCSHEWKYYAREQDNFSTNNLVVGVQCSKCGKTREEANSWLNLGKFINMIETQNISDKQDCLKEIYEFCFYVNKNFNTFSQPNINPDIDRVRKINQWLKKFLKIKIF